MTTFVFASSDKLFLKDLERMFRTTAMASPSQLPPLVINHTSDYLVSRLQAPVIRLIPTQTHNPHTVGTSSSQWLGNGYYNIHAPVHNDTVLDGRGAAYWACRAALLMYCKLVSTTAFIPRYVLIDPFGPTTQPHSRVTARQMYNAVVDVLLWPPHPLTDALSHDPTRCDARPIF